MPPSTILVVGSTGNTGTNVVRTLPKLLEGTGVRVLGLTRSRDGETAKGLSQLPGVEMEETDWTVIDSAWINERSVVKAFIAPQNNTSQFTDESGFYLALLDAGVKYVVRISTNVRYMSPTSHVWYGRAHWAIENLLSQPEFNRLSFTSLRPNFFTASYLAGAAEFIKEFRKTGKQLPLAVVLDENVPVAMIDPEDVGRAAAHLLAHEDFSSYDNQCYVLSGPADVTGRDIVRLVEKITGVSVERTTYKDVQWLRDMFAAGTYPQKLFPSIMSGFDCLWDGSCAHAATPTSNAIVMLARPTRTIEEALRVMIKE